MPQNIDENSLQKGLSPLLATVLIISITVAIATLVMGWMTNVTKDVQWTVGNKTTYAVDCSAADISVDAVYMDFNANKSRVSVRNAGFVDDKVVSASMQNTFGDALSTITSMPMNFTRGAQATIEFNLSGKMSNCNNFSQVIVTTQCTYDKFKSTPKGC